MSDDVERWEPDENLITAASAGKVTLTVLDPPDRSWVVAALIARGHTSVSMSDLLHCSLRLINQIRILPATVACRYAAELEVELSKVRASTSAEIRAISSAVAMTQRDALRYREQRDQLIDAEKRRRQRAGAPPAPVTGIAAQLTITVDGRRYVAPNGWAMETVEADTVVDGQTTRAAISTHVLCPECGHAVITAEGQQVLCEHWTAIPDGDDIAALIESEAHR